MNKVKTKIYEKLFEEIIYGNYEEIIIEDSASEKVGKFIIKQEKQ